jgi:Na+/proline symporter
MEISLSELISRVMESDYSRVFNTAVDEKTHFIKQFLSGIFIAIVMTGLDQDMMQKNLSCRSLPEAKKNVYWMSASLVPVNMLILLLGASLFIFANSKGIAIPERSDNLFPIIALQHLPAAAGIVFMIGLISAAYSSADSALTSLTTSFAVDFLNINKRKNLKELDKRKLRHVIHFFIAGIIVLIIIVFRAVNDDSVISRLFTIAGYTYGPLLGMFFFGLFTKIKVKDRWIPVVAVLSPIASYFLSLYSEELFFGYKFGFELLLVNGALTALGLYFLKK